MSDSHHAKKSRLEAVENKSQQFSLGAKVLNGCIAGIIGVTAIYPLDLVKTRIQSQAVGKRYCTTILECLLQVIRKDGYFGVYKGTLAYLICITPEKAIKLSMNDFAKFQLQDENGNVSLPKQVCSAAFAAMCAIWITNPTDVLKIDLQRAGLDEGTKRKTAFEIIKKLYRENGVIGFYRGFKATMTRDLIFTSINFPLFAFFTTVFPKDAKGNTTFWGNFFSGLCAGSITAWSVTPADVMKTRLQLVSNIDNSIKYNSIFHAARTIFKTEGIRAFYKGGACRIMVVGPLYAVAQGVYYLKVAEHIMGMT